MLPFQKRIVKTVWENERTAVYACHDIGKTFTISKIVLAFTSIFTGAKVITTAPTFNQVKRLLWSEIRAGFERSVYPLGGEMLMTEWKIAEDWFALGFTARGEKGEGEGQGKASSAQGFHAPYVLVVFDEATGIPLSIWQQIEGILTSGFVRFVGIGNPTTKNCEFFKCISDPTYQKIHLNCFDSPNYPANGLHCLEDLLTERNRLKELSESAQAQAFNDYKIVDQHLLTVRWGMRLVLKYGVDHPLVVSKLLGQFPEEDKNTLMSLGIVQAAQYREVKPRDDDEISIGVDVARFGSDKTVITCLRGVQVIERQVLIHRDTMEIVGHVVRMILAYPKLRSHVVIDATGIGSGVVDGLEERRSECVIPDETEIRETHFGWGADAHEVNEKKRDELKKKYANIKALIFILLAEDLQSKLCLLNEEIYSEELPTIQYRFDSKGRWVIESKDEYKARTGRESPDDADSLALANYGRYEASKSGNFSETLLHSEKRTFIGAQIW